MDEPIAGVPIAGAQGFLVGLAQWAHGNRRNDFDALRRVVRTFLSFTRAIIFCNVEDNIFSRDHDGGYSLPPLLIGDSNHSHRGHAFVRGDDIFDLSRKHVESARYDHVFLSINDGEEPLPIPSGNIARVEPPSSGASEVSSGLFQ